MATHSTMTLGRLATFLQDQRRAFLQDLENGTAQGWVIAMGNEAGGAWHGAVYHLIHYLPELP